MLLSIVVRLWGGVYGPSPGSMGMNKFVNFGKRGVDLPAGCKDLIDVLRRAREHPVETLSTLSVQGLASVGKHLPSLLESAAKSKNLVITWDEMNYVHLMNEEGVITALTVTHENTHRVRAVREVFDAAGLSPIYDEPVVHRSVRLLRYRLPADESSIGELVLDLLRKGYGLAENAKLEIGSWENDGGS